MEFHTTEYISLESINPAVNRHRAYSISVMMVETSKRLYIVTCGWGRHGRLSSKKHFSFEQQTEMKQFIKTLLHKRKQHHYQIVNTSPSFEKYFPSAITSMAA